MKENELQGNQARYKELKKVKKHQIKQKEIEKTGRYVTIKGDKKNTQLFVKFGENVEEKIKEYNGKHNY